MFKFNLLQKMTLTAMMIALYLTATRVAYVPITPMVRLSAGPAVLIFSSILLGPISGAIVGGCGDLMGALLMPYLGMAINPLMTVSYIAMGAVPGLLMILFNKIKNYKHIPEIIYCSFLLLIWVGVLVFSLTSNSVEIFSFTYELNMTAKIILPIVSFIVTGLIVLFTFWINRHFKKKIDEDNRIPSPFYIAFIVMFIEVFFTLLLNPYLKSSYYGDNTYSAVLFTSLLIAFIYIPVNTLVVSYLCLLASKVINPRE